MYLHGKKEWLISLYFYENRMKTMDTNSKFFMIYCMKTFMIQG